MSDKSIAKATYSSQIEVEVEADRAKHTRYGGILAYQRVWERFGCDQLLQETGVTYGQAENKGPEMTFALSTAPLIEAGSVRQVAQRYGGEPSELEADELVSHLLPVSFSQRQLSRFMNQERHDWAGLNWGRVLALQQLKETAMTEEGVLILDDFTLAKPYARVMDYLEPVWDNCLKRKVHGYLIVHLYYYHPNRPSYPLVLTPWLKTSATGEKKAKTARRRAKPDEELSRLDLGHQALAAVKTRQLPFAAVVFDSWYTVRWLSHELTRLNIPWIGEVSANQKLIVEGQKLSVAQIWERYADQMTPVEGLKSGLKAYALSAINPADAYTKVDQPVQLVLTEGLHQPRDKDQGRHLLISNQRLWSTRRLVRLFSYRPHIEPRHRLGKQEQGWLDFHTQSLAALQAHLAISLLRDTLLHLLRLWVPALAEYSFAQMIRYWIGYIADLTVLAVGKLKVHLGPDHPAWAFILGSDPPPASLLSFSVVNFH